MTSQPGLLEYVPALGPLPRLVRLLATLQRHDFAAGSLLGVMSAAAANRTCVEALARLESVGPVLGAVKSQPQHTALGVALLEKMITCGAGVEEFAQQAVSVELVSQLLKLLEDVANPHVTSATRALIVSILKGLTVSRLNGPRVAALLDQSPCWASYRHQRHDLFLGAAGAPLPVAGASTAAGYLTEERAGPVRPPADALPRP